MTKKIVIEIKEVDDEENSNIERYRDIKKILPKSSHVPIGQCPKCGLDLYPVMGYVCMRNPCPSGLGSNVLLQNEVRVGSTRELLVE